MSAPNAPLPPPVVSSADTKPKGHTKPPSSKLLKVVEEVANAAPAGRLSPSVVELVLPPSAALYRKELTVFFVSDTHNGHADITVPDNVDIFIHCGDFTNKGDWRAMPDGDASNLPRFALPSAIKTSISWLFLLFCMTNVQFCCSIQYLAWYNQGETLDCNCRKS